MKKMLSYFIAILVLSCHISIVISEKFPRHLEFLFGDGDLDYRAEHEIKQHLSSSTEDLILLCDAERRLAQLLSEIPRTATNFSLVEKYLKTIDYNISDDNFDSESYVSHPINAFHLMKRATNTLRKLQHQVSTNFKSESFGSKVLDLIDSIALPEKDDFQFGASYGMMILEWFHNLEIDKLAKGIIFDTQTGKKFISNSALTSVDLSKIASAAKETEFFKSSVMWSQAALKAAKSERRSISYISKLERILKVAIQIHDQEVGKTIRLHSTHPTHIFTVFMNLNPLGKPKIVTEKFFQATEQRRSVQNSIESFENLIHEAPRIWATDSQRKIKSLIDYYLFPRIQALCNGESVRPPKLNANLSCTFLHHGNPFLKLGPFKFEMLHTSPEIGMFHHLASSSLTETFKARARGKMKTTPFLINNNQESYSKLRTSKIVYINEHKVEAAKSLSNTIELATRFNLYSHPLDSENYQVMNYGIGGTISGHVDTLGETEGTAEAFGGTRFVTFMVYMSNVTLGGNTVFPQSGISVKPTAGDALYWFNHDNLQECDSRTYHLGCPVAIGNKWIANKWVKWTGQMWNYPCGVKKEKFSILAKPN